MRVCYLSNNDMPSKMANSIQTIKMCEALVENGNDVLLISPNSEKIKDSIFEYYNVKTKFNFIKLKRYKKFPLGFKYYFFSIESIFASLRYKPDIYITRNFFTSFLLCLLRKKNILELHHPLDIESRVVRFITKRLKFFKSKYLIRFIAISNKAGNYYSKFLDFNDTRIHILPSGSSLKKKINNNFKKRTKVKIGVFGSIYKWNIDLLVKLSIIDKNNYYFIYGDKRNAKLKLSNFKNNLFFKDYVEYKNIEKELNKMDILLMPYNQKITSGGNVGDITNFTSPLKLFDYLTTGKIIISSDLPALREILTNKNSIFIKNFNNPNLWKLEINKIINNFEKRTIFSKNNFKLSKRYGLKKRALRFLEGF